MTPESDTWTDTPDPDIFRSELRRAGFPEIANIVGDDCWFEWGFLPRPPSRDEVAAAHAALRVWYVGLDEWSGIDDWYADIVKDWPVDQARLWFERHPFDQPFEPEPDTQ